MTEWKWEPNITVSIWGRGKATLSVRSMCPLTQERCYTPKNMIEAEVSDSKGPRFPGDCDNCQHFRGAGIHRTPMWGEQFKACCGALMNAKTETVQ